MLLSIIVPVYQVEKYIRPCIESIFTQGLNDEDFEVIIVNDGTIDNSMGAIQDVIEKHHNINVINQENQGLSIARNNGMAIAKGDYISFLDSDDMFTSSTIFTILKLAIEYKPDLIVADFLRMNNHEIEIFAVAPKVFNSSDYETIHLSGIELLKQHNPRHCYVWSTIYKRSFLESNNLRFVPGIMFEDIPFTHECYLKAKSSIKT